MTKWGPAGVAPRSSSGKKSGAPARTNYAPHKRRLDPGPNQTVTPGPTRVDTARHVHGERVLYDNRWVRLTKVDVTPPNGERFEHHVVRLHRVVLVLVVDDAERVLMLWRHRFITDSWGWELPGGIAEEGETDEVTASREMVEETGWRPRTLRPWVEFQPMPGMVDTPHAVLLADGADRVGEPSDAEEASRVEWVPLGQLPGLVERGDIGGAGSLVALLRLVAERRIRQP